MFTSLLRRRNAGIGNRQGRAAPRAASTTACEQLESRVLFHDVAVPGFAVPGWTATVPHEVQEATGITLTPTAPGSVTLNESIRFTSADPIVISFQRDPAIDPHKVDDRKDAFLITVNATNGTGGDITGLRVDLGDDPSGKTHFHTLGSNTSDRFSTPDPAGTTGTSIALGDGRVATGETFFVEMSIHAPGFIPALPNEPGADTFTLTQTPVVEAAPPPPPQQIASTP